MSDSRGPDSAAAEERADGPAAVRATITVLGRVQGVGFRWAVQRRANALDLSGWARNLPDRSVEVVAEGSRERVDELLVWLRGGGTPGTVRSVAVYWGPAQAVVGFSTL